VTLVVALAFVVLASAALALALVWLLLSSPTRLGRLLEVVKPVRRLLFKSR